MGTAEKADCTINMSTGDLIIVVRMSDLQIIRINHRFFSADDDWGKFLDRTFLFTRYSETCT